MANARRKAIRALAAALVLTLLASGAPALADPLEDSRILGPRWADPRWIDPSVPTLVRAASSGDAAADPSDRERRLEELQRERDAIDTRRPQNAAYIGSILGIVGGAATGVLFAGSDTGSGGDADTALFALASGTLVVGVVTASVGLTLYAIRKNRREELDRQILELSEETEPSVSIGGGVRVGRVNGLTVSVSF